VQQRITFVPKDKRSYELYEPAGLRDAEEAEAIAVLEGIRFADRWPNETHVEIEFDCANLVSKVKGSTVDRSVTSTLVLDIKEAMNRRLSFSI
jgi:hypothetical protein